MTYFKTYANEMYGEWLQPTEREVQLQSLAEQYHTRCEAYDVGVCSGISPRTGDAMPTNGHESALINRNARKVHIDVVREGASLGFTEWEVTKAIQNYVKGKA